MSAPPPGAGVAVGLIDSGLAPALAARAAADVAVQVDADGQATIGAARADAVGHGSALAALLLAAAPAVRLYSVQAFAAAGPGSAAAVAAALDWLVAQRVRVVNLSLGLRADRPRLRAAVAAAQAAGVLLVASSPARGGPVYPAAYPGVLRVCGDARCADGEFSALGGHPADIGASPAGGGASLACARVSAALAALLAATPDIDATALRRALQARCRFHGAERRHGD
ncbi:subtilase family protein [Plasticicumulans lactativorans]|uniref:Subtilase family protein n=1 Tax=Plasticicumulans lactativorans TaxID=1133106 RepID=A0A4R2LF29_9GAMM|nr:S8 family serine peptidase [Plasticicumulans lactativorans]TCO83357.1 subtilase family protein [Plasticicumulans lactativorans]